MAEIARKMTHENCDTDEERAINLKPVDGRRQCRGKCGNMHTRFNACYNLGETVSNCATMLRAHPQLFSTQNEGLKRTLGSMTQYLPTERGCSRHLGEAPNGDA